MNKLSNYWNKGNYCANYVECRNSITHGNNGIPLFNGRVCDDCNELVVRERYFLFRMNEQ